MSTIVSLLLSLVVSIAVAAFGPVSGNGLDSTVKPTGQTASETTTENNQASYGLNARQPQDNFGAWVSSLTPEEPKADGTAFGEKVSTVAKENGEKVGQEEPSIEPPVEPPVEPPSELPPGPPTITPIEPPIGTPIINIPCDNWNNDVIVLPQKPMWGDFCLLY